ncbi:MAG: Hpt domain-containing protein [Planctomycetota bacterium]
MIPELDGRPVMDEAAALDMVEGERDLLEEILELFEDCTRDRVAELRESVASGELDRVSSAAHAIKGAAANICAERIRLLAAQMESDARQGVVADISEMSAMLEAEFDRFVAEVEFTA